MKRLRRYGLVLGIGVLLGGCAPAVGQAPIVDAPLAPDVGVSTTATRAAGTPETTLLPLLTSLAPTPTIRPGMEATDPNTVSLSPGDPTLVEFFAFW
jgi:hypothetical protein